MSKLKIKGTVQYQDLGPGFWGIIGDDGQNYRAVNMPEQLKKADAKVAVTAKKVDGMSLFMWGTSIKIVSFHTLMP